MINKEIEILEAYLRSRNWQVEKLKDSSTYRLVIPAGDEQLVGYALAFPHELMFYPVAPITVPPHRFAAVSEYLTRINNDLWTCDFELDYLTGQVRCKASFAFHGQPLEIQLVENMIYNPVDALLHYLPGLMEVVADKTSPGNAAERLHPPRPGESEHDEEAQLLYKTVIQFFDEENWAYHQLYDYYTRITYTGHNYKSYYCYATMLASQKKFFFSIGLPGAMEDRNEAAIVEWMTRINYNLKLGYFLFNFADSAMSFVNGVDFYGLTPKTQLIRNVIYPALATADKYWPNLKQVIDGTASPVEALPEEMKETKNG
ncbi:MAG: YbjN domain-containing protein [Anaerolineae bacterium]|nr:YbjN domain-containing protein [Anaerolineae bacterium]